jgi:hypothetical protein
MITPQEKALELVNKFYNKQIEILSKYDTAPYDEVEYEIAKQCALIACDEVLDIVQYNTDDEYAYWQQVKNEIEKIK